MQTNRTIATVNAVCGGVAAIGIVLAIGGMIAANAFPIVGILVVAVFALIDASLIHSAVLHLRSPTRKSALMNASNASVIIWLLLAWLMRESGLRGLIGPMYVLVPLGAAFLVYRLFLRPVALRAFPEDTKNAEAEVSHDGR